MKKSAFPILLLVVLSILLTACAGNAGQAGSISVSGYISAREVRIAPEISGTIAEISVMEGDVVEQGDPLFRIDAEAISMQVRQAEAAVQVAGAAVSAATAQKASADAQLALATQAARLQDQQQRALTLQAVQPEQFDLPSWYFQKDEEISALDAEIQAAQDALDTELDNLETTLENASNEDFMAVENRLAEAQAAFAVANQALTLAQTAQDRIELEDAAQKRYDSALAELRAAQNEYNSSLGTSAAQDVLEARGRVAAAQLRLDTANDQMALLQTGDQSLQVEAAVAAAQAAGAALDQAQAGQAQAQAALDLANLQAEKAVVKAPVDGTILAINLEAGELVPAGSVVVTIGRLERVEVIVYIPEGQYGRVKVGQTVTLQSDSFPGQTFSGNVTTIADEAEFTPRNVQTTDGRQSTVYAIKVEVENTDGLLKPGMPVDVTFTFGE